MWTKRCPIPPPRASDVTASSLGLGRQSRDTQRIQHLTPPQPSSPPPLPPSHTAPSSGCSRAPARPDRLDVPGGPVDAHGHRVAGCAAAGKFSARARCAPPRRRILRHESALTPPRRTPDRSSSARAPGHARPRHRGRPSGEPVPRRRSARSCCRSGPRTHALRA